MYDPDHKPEIHASRVHRNDTEWYTFSDFCNFSFWSGQSILLILSCFDRNVSSLMNCRINNTEQSNVKRKYQTFKTVFS